MARRRTQEKALKKAKTKIQMQKYKSMKVIAVIVVLFFIIMNINMMNLRKERAVLMEKENALKISIQEAQKERVALEKQREYMNTDKYIEDMAKEKLGLIYPNEKIFKPKTKL